MDEFFSKAGNFIRHHHVARSGVSTTVHVVVFTYERGVAEFDGRAWTYTIK